MYIEASFSNLLRMVLFYFLEKEFVEDYLGDWERELNATPNLTRETRNRIMLSQQTLLRWKISG